MSLEASCEHCGDPFPVPKSVVGGITDRPACGKATGVPGLRDPLWRLAQAAIAARRAQPSRRTQNG